MRARTDLPIEQQIVKILITDARRWAYKSHTTTKHNMVELYELNSKIYFEAAKLCEKALNEQR